MARRKRRSKRHKLQPAQLNLTYGLGDGVSYIDLAKDLSQCNRKLFSQGYVYAVAGVTYTFTAGPTTPDVVSMSVATAGDTWSVQNSHTKGKALWNEMNQLVLKDNPSIKGTWADFKVYLDDHHEAVGSVAPLDGDGNPVLPGEWEYSQFVMPQHEVDPATGLPLAADQFVSHLIGPDTATSRGLIKAYASSRASVQEFSPEVPAVFGDSFFNLLTDSGSQEPELADVIEDANDQPPYDYDNYPGGGSNAPTAWFQQHSSASIGSPTGFVPGFQAECGLVKVHLDGSNASGETATVPATLVTFHLVPGSYQGVMAERMGQ